MKFCCGAIALACLVINGYSQAFSFRDPAWVGFISRPVASGNNAVFNSATHVYHLQESAGSSRLDSIGSISLAETGGTVNMSASGIHNNCVDFQPVSQAGHYLAMSSDVPDLNTSMILWVYVRTLPISGKISIIFGEKVVANNIVLWLDSAGNVNFQDDGIGGEDTTISMALGSLNAWHMIACVSSVGDGNEYLSVDGATFVSDAGQGHYIGDNFALSFGYINVPSNAPLVPDALIDEPVIFSSALSQSDVTTLWASGSGIFRSP